VCSSIHLSEENISPSWITSTPASNVFEAFCPSLSKRKAHKNFKKTLVQEAEAENSGTPYKFLPFLKISKRPNVQVEGGAHTQK